jgi:hypothetical protein
VHLPTHLPNSIHEENGQIKYSVHVKVHQTGRTDEFSEDFKVVCPIKFDASSWESSLSKDSAEKVTLCCCFNRGYLSCNLQILKPGFVPGEDIELKTLVNNPTSSDVNILEFHLVKNVIYESSDPKIHTKTQETYIFYEIVPIEYKLQNSSKEYHHKYKIPYEATPSTETKVIQVRYTVSALIQVNFDLNLYNELEICNVNLQTLPLCDTSPKCDLPIQIGMIRRDEIPIFSQPVSLLPPVQDMRNFQI